MEEANNRRDEYLARRVEEQERDQPNAKQPRVADLREEAELRVDLAPGASGSGLKREREGDAEEEDRPTQFRMTEVIETEDVHIEDYDSDATEDLGMVDINVSPDHVPRGPALGTLGYQSNVVDKKTRRWNDDVMYMETKIKETERSIDSLDKKYKELHSVEQRGGKKNSRYLVAEAFSPPRVCKRARERGLTGGWSLDWMHTDPITGAKWDLRDPDAQERIVKMIYRDRPELLILSPPCTLFSMLQNLAEHPETRCPKLWQEAVGMVDFAVRLCRIQLKSGRHFIFEHPLSASSWRRTTLRELQEEDGVFEAKTHMCAFGMTSRDQDGEGAVLKPTKFLTSSQTIQELLTTKCSRDHRHVHLVNGRAKAAAEYPLKLVDAMIDGILMEKVVEPNKHMKELNSLHEEIELEEQYIDDSIGKYLDAEKVRMARKEEMETFKSMGVYDYVKKEVYDANPGGKKIGVRWVDIDKGSRVRSRLVAQEFAHGELRDDLFAGTPPLSATKALISDIASNGKCEPKKLRLMVLDIKRAFLYGDMEEDIVINLPPEDPQYGRGYYGRLKKAMYGTRAAPLAWQRVVHQTMKDLGFERSLRNSCVYIHREKNMKVVAHVDDFLCSGELGDLVWLRDALAKNFDLTHEIVGPGKDEVRVAKYLGRSVQWTAKGIEYKADDNHVKILLDEWDLHDSKPVATPGIAEEKQNKEDVSLNELLDRDGARRYRRAAARINYLAQDRADISFTAKELSRAMANPTQGDIVRLKRALRYLQGHPIAIQEYEWQERPARISTFVDSDWAGCSRTRKSTSGGAITHGAHLLGHWSSTQSNIALSSGEAELNAMVKGGTETLGAIGIMNDLGQELSGCVLTDSSAAKGISARDGSGKVKHLEVKQLWIQQAVQDGKLSVTKVPRAENPSDALTHNWLSVEGDKHFPKISLRREKAFSMHSDKVFGIETRGGDRMQQLSSMSSIASRRRRQTTAVSSDLGSRNERVRNFSNFCIRLTSPMHL